MRLTLPEHVTFHARGDEAFAWNGLTGEVTGMSRDVVALCAAYKGGALVADVSETRPGGLGPGQSRALSDQLRDLGLLLDEGADPLAKLGDRYPFVPDVAVFFKDARGTTVYGRAVTLPLDAATAAAYAQCNGVTRLAKLHAADVRALLRLCAPGVVGLKLLPKRAMPGTRGVPPWAHSTMPHPEVDPAKFAAGENATAPEKLASYHKGIADADAQFEETETTLSHLFREPHPALSGRTFGESLGDALVKRLALREGALSVLEIGGGLGWVGAHLRRRLEAAGRTVSYATVELSPALARAQARRGNAPALGDALALPVKSASVDLVVSNEMVGDLGTKDGVNAGAVALVHEAARVLKAGGGLYVSEFGNPTLVPAKSDHLDHDEHSIRFDSLREAAALAGFTRATVMPLPALLELNGDAPALVTTRASFAALRRLFADHGVTLDKRAWTKSALEAACAGKVDLASVHGTRFSPLGERTMGLVPEEFWALLAVRA